jgi:hypothetical protein
LIASSYTFFMAASVTAALPSLISSISISSLRRMKAIRLLKSLSSAIFLPSAALAARITSVR